MRTKRHLLGISFGAGIVVALACSTSTVVVSAQDGGLGDAGGARFGDSPCGSCVKQACAAAITTCNSSPECVTYVACVEGCGVGPDGNVDPTCASACPKGSSSAGLQAEQQIDACRTSGPGAACSACGVDGGGGNPIIHQTCPPGQDTKPCYLCEDNNCCHTYDACKANPECGAYKSCLIACGPTSSDAGLDGGATTCEQLCSAQHPAGIKDWAPREACIFVHCLNDCSSGAPDPCVACLVSKCPEPFANLHGTTDGYLLTACVTPCGTDTLCRDKCIAKYPAAKSAWDALVTCIGASCTTTCGS